MADQSSKMSPRTMAATSAGIGVFLAFATFVAGELDRLYGGDHGFGRTELVLIAYAGLWTPCVMLLTMWRGSRIFGSFEQYSDFYSQLKTGRPESGVDLDVLRRTIRFQWSIHYLDLLHGLVNVTIVATLVLSSTFHHWLTAAWFAVGAVTAFTGGRRSRTLRNRLVTELGVRTSGPGRRASR